MKIAVFVLLFLSLGQQTAFAASPTKSVWQIIHILRNRSAMTPESVEQDLNTRLRLQQQNEYTVFYTGEGPALNDELRIAHVDFRMPVTSPRNSFLVLSLEGKGCITLEDVKKHYGGLALSQVPHGHSLEEQTGYRTVFNHWAMGFGFKEKRPDCLASVVFDSDR